MTLWMMIFLIVLTGCITSVLTERYKAMGRLKDEADAHSQQRLSPDPDAQREIAELRERIKVLERIATDANSTESLEIKAISAEIEKLRDK